MSFAVPGCFDCLLVRWRGFGVVNCFDHGDMTLPWGGYKQSGQGRDKCFESMLLHTQTKSVWIHLG